MVQYLSFDMTMSLCFQSKTYSHSLFKGLWNPKCHVTHMYAYKVAVDQVNSLLILPSFAFIFFIKMTIQKKILRKKNWSSIEISPLFSFYITIFALNISKRKKMCVLEVRKISVRNTLVTFTTFVLVRGSKRVILTCKNTK